MDLPETNLLNFFNKVLISLEELTPIGDSCSVEALINQCQSVVFGGQRGEYDSVLSHCKYCGLLQIKNKSVTISALGLKFLSANRERFFEINEAQKQLITERIVFKGPWNIHARELFEHFSLNQTSATYELPIAESPLSKNMNATIHFFKYLGILQEEEFVIQVVKRYVELVYLLTADSKAITEQQLEKILMENRKIGAQAENAVVEFEKKRLEKLGKPAQAAMVKRISTLNVAAGYDIESFDGTSDEIFPNRFIEVKATTSHEIRFYWSNNEMSVAKKKKEVYWIYMLKEFREDKPEHSIPIMIQNPEQVIPQHALLSMEVNKYFISEISEIELNEKSIEELKWYQIF